MVLGPAAGNQSVVRQRMRPRGLLKENRHGFHRLFSNRANCCTIILGHFTILKDDFSVELSTNNSQIVQPVTFPRWGTIL